MNLSMDRLPVNACVKRVMKTKGPLLETSDLFRSFR